MSKLSRRRLLAGAPVVIGGALLGSQVADAAGTSPTGGTEPAAPAVVRPGDSRYPELVVGDNLRFTATPDYVVLPTTAEQVRQAVQDAVMAGKRFTIRSGGHCYENFVFSSDTKVVIDLSLMNSVTFDTRRNAFSIQAGATLLNIYETLFPQFGVTIPGGTCYSVGAGGHIAGGGYGMWSRLFGLTVDHLYGVEVVVVGADKVARLVVATQAPNDPNRDLWWAHTGGGGGNFGVVTRYLMRSPNATGTDPGQLLPRPPSTVLVSSTTVNWAGLDQTGFVRLVNNYGQWLAANSAPGAPTNALTPMLQFNHVSAGSSGLLALVDGDVPNARAMLDAFVSAALAGVTATPGVVRTLPWLHAQSLLATHQVVLTDPTQRGEHKSAYFRRTPTEAQSIAMFQQLTRTDFVNPNAAIVLFSFGGQINAVASGATALPQRDSIMKMLVQSFWYPPSADAANIAWARDVYGDIFATTGGVPEHNDLTDGCYVNYPDVDLGDPQWNRSTTPWSALYYKGNYPRLQQIKARFDPNNLFHHAQSIELP